MKTGPQEPSRFKMPKLGIIAAVVLLILVIIFVAWYGNRDTNSGDTSSALPAGWSVFRSEKYSLQFNYPSSWGKPQITAQKGKSGSHYQINFLSDAKKPSSKSLTVSIGMDSGDYISPICKTNCTSANTLTGQTIQKNLNSGVKSYTKSDNSSYAFISTIPSAKTSSLTQAQIVNLPSLKVSAALGLYTLSGVSGCPSGQLAPSSKPSCINQSDYDALNNVLKSIEAF